MTQPGTSMTQPDTAPNPPAEAPAEPSTDTDKTFTQADVDRLIADRLKRAKPADYDDLRKKAGRLDELEAASQTEQERSAKQLAEAQQRATENESRAMRLEVAFAKGLTPAQAKRLVGSTLDELETDADEILVDFPVKTDGRPRGDADQGTRVTPPPSDPRSADLAQIEADIKTNRRK